MHIRSTSILCVFLASAGIAQDRQKVHSFALYNVELRAGLDSLLQWYGVPMIYLDKDVAGKRVTAACQDCGIEEALSNVTEGQGLLWKVVGEQVLLQRRESEDELASFAGTIRDSLTGEGVAAVDVLLLRREPVTPSYGPGLSETVYRWCSTNQFGFFSLRNILPGTYTLRIRRIGYRTMNESVSIRPGESINRGMSVSVQEVVHPGITVEGRRSIFSTSEGIARGVYIRAAPSDQNQYLLEGARIYNPHHFGGVMSTFNVDALRDVQVIAGGVPPFYGGRIGGILDLSIRDGTEKAFEGTAAVGSLSSSLVLEGPLANQTTFLVSGRKNYPDILLQRYHTYARPSDLNSSEAMAKVTHHISDNQRLSLGGYLGWDTYRNRVVDVGGNELVNSLRWRNASASIRWLTIVPPSLFLFTSAAYTSYGFDTEHRFGGIGASASELFLSNYRIEDAAVRAHAEYFYDEYHTVMAGVELVRHQMAGRISEFSSQVSPMSFEGVAPWELAVYFQDQWRLIPSVQAEFGARATTFIAKQGSFSAVDPRFSLVVSPRDDLRFFSSLSAVNQFVHPYRHSGIFLFYPTIFLYPSSENIRPTTSLQISLGMQKSIHENRYQLSVDTYYRTTQNLHEFVYDSTGASELSEALLLGEGNVYGIEVTIDKRFGDFSGSVRYGLSWSSNRFTGLNNGEPFRPRFDRRHELYATLSYSPLENWTLGMTCLLSGDQLPSLLPGRVAADAAASPGARLEVTAMSRYAEPYDLNGGRLPGFQRLELRMAHRLTWLGLESDATLRLLNGYGLVDPFVWQLLHSTDNRLRWRAVVDAPSLFPLYPVVGVSVRF